VDDFFTEKKFTADENKAAEKITTNLISAMRYLVADDDPLVCETVESFLLRFEDTEYCLKAHDGLSALQLLSEGSIDAAFLDVQMPGLGGGDVLKALPRRLPVVIISASGEFAAASYEFRVSDYLLKPLGFERFAQAVARMREQRAEEKGEPSAGEGARITGRDIFVKDGTRLVRISLESVSVVRAEANYVEFHHDGGQTLCLITLKRLEELMPEGFVRTHRSWMVNWRRINKIEEGVVHLGPHRVPVSDGYRERLYQVLPVLG
jgi:two-component system, LytTR family, response regulator